MENLIKEHIKLFGKEPYIIYFWRDMAGLENAIKKAIKDNKPYNEYELLSKEEQKAFDDGGLLF